MSQRPAKKLKTDAHSFADVSMSASTFFTPLSQRRKVEPSWRTQGSLLICEFRQEVREERPEEKELRLAAFDLDGTLIQTRSGKLFSQDASDWKFLYPQIKPALAKLSAEGYTLVIFSNQNGISLGVGKKRLQQFKDKMRGILLSLALPVICYAATGKDNYRKPITGMFDQFLADHLKGRVLDHAKSFFVGDASGTAAAGKDGEMSAFSCSDRKFARNIQLPFKTPGEYFLGSDSEKFVWTHLDAFDPFTFASSAKHPLISASSSSLEIILFVGPPASGKTTFYFKNLEPLGLVRVNQDTLKSREKCFKVATEALDQGKSVVVDNTNLKKEVRKEWIDFCQQRNISIRCILFRTPLAILQHNNAYRAFAKSSGDREQRALLPEKVLKSFDNTASWPDDKEPFLEIIEIPFVPDPEKTGWRQWYQCNGGRSVVGR